LQAQAREDLDDHLGINDSGGDEDAEGGVRQVQVRLPSKAAGGCASVACCSSGSVGGKHGTAQ
jgi:hypothetical protein